MKKIFVAPLPQLLPANWANERTIAIVIDTLRFTSTACVALQAGAKEVRVAAEVDTARELAKKNIATPRALLCGERHCHPIEGFDLGNSPFEYTALKVAHHPLVFSTTNGTLAVAAARPASQIILASLLNRAAVVDHLLQSDCSTVWIVCAGTDGQIAFEDVLAAGAILMHDRIVKQTAAADSNTLHLANDSALMATHLFQSLGHSGASPSPPDLASLISKAVGGQNLISAGYERDIGAVAELDSSDIVPRNSVNDSSVFVAAGSTRIIPNSTRQ
jgi:2-phosphosulfolactate phosphatase